MLDKLLYLILKPKYCDRCASSLEKVSTVVSYNIKTGKPTKKRIVIRCIACRHYMYSWYEPIK